MGNPVAGLVCSNSTCWNSISSFELDEDFTNMMLSQDPNNPIIKKMMIMEGLNKWVKVTNKELEGYEVLAKAMKDQNLLENSI